MVVIKLTDLWCLILGSDLIRDRRWTNLGSLGDLVGVSFSGACAATGPGPTSQPGLSSSMYKLFLCSELHSKRENYLFYAVLIMLKMSI